jgi:hypothetical protein
MDWKGFGIVLLFLVTLGDKLGLLKWFRGPEKREVSFATEHPSKQEFNELGQRLTNIEAYGAQRRKAIYERMESIQRDTGGQLQALREEMKGDMTQIHEKMNGVSQDVAGVAAQVEMIRTDMVHLIHGRK